MVRILSYVIQMFSYLLIRIYNLYLQKHKQKSDKKLISDMEIVHFHRAAVRGSRYYKQFWKPIENKELYCLHEKFSFYDSLLSRQYTRMTKMLVICHESFRGKQIFFLDRGFSILVKLSSRNYRRPPLVKGGMEIPCVVSFSKPSTLKNAQLAER